MKLLRAPLYLIITLLFSTSVFAQQISNVQATLQGDNIVVTYDLSAQNSDDRFNIRLYSSHNNYSAPVSLASGDVGIGITPGNGKRITWQARQELSAFTGNITFEVRGSLIAPAQTEEQPTDPNQFRFTTPIAGSKFKMGGLMNVRWSGGLPQDVKLELHRNNTLVQTLTTAPNSGGYDWNIPKDKTLKGDGLSLKLFNSNQPGNAVFSGAFKIKGKIPVVVYIAVPVVVGGVVALLLSGDGGGDGGGSNGNTSTDLPTPPRPDGG